MAAVRAKLKQMITCITYISACRNERIRISASKKPGRKTPDCFHQEKQLAYPGPVRERNLHVKIVQVADEKRDGGDDCDEENDLDKLA